MCLCFCISPSWTARLIVVIIGFQRDVPCIVISLVSVLLFPHCLSLVYDHIYLDWACGMMHVFLVLKIVKKLIPIIQTIYQSYHINHPNNPNNSNNPILMRMNMLKNVLDCVTSLIIQSAHCNKNIQSLNILHPVSIQQSALNWIKASAL